MTLLRTRAPSIRTLIIALALFALSLYLFDSKITSPIWNPSPYHSSSGSNNRPGIGRRPISDSNPLQTKQLVNFWREFVDVLGDAKPQSKEIKPNGQASHEDEMVDIKAAKTHPRLDITEVDEQDLLALRASHEFIVDKIKSLGPKLPYTPGTRGVAMTAGGRYFGVAITSVRMLRRSGSVLPVEVFLDSWDDYDIATCERILPALNAKCLVMAELWDSTPKFGKLLKYQYKTFALLFSSFEDVLFLDADAFPAHNPDILLDVEPYKSTGLVTWPDFWVSTTSHYFYEIAGIPVPALDSRRSSESGIMIYSKRLQAESLLLATYYNYYGPGLYYPLFSQGAQGEGDKESFLHAAMALDKPFYDVRTPVKVLGAWLNGTWYTAGMKQSDPIEDWSLSRVSKSLPKDENDGEQDKEKHDEDARPIFIHNNLVKMDAAHLFESVDSWRDGNGELVKLWGSTADMTRQFGYDVERVLWEELCEAACEIDEASCKRTKAHFEYLYTREDE
jgi:alpha 1,2-mannosyltransferase